MCAEEGRSTAWLQEAAADFDTMVALRSVTRTMWDVPATELWYVDGASYIGTVMIRHELTPQLLREGGNIGYHVVPGQRRRGHATAMLAAACGWCRDLGLTRVLVTCSAANIASRRVIEANAGILDSEDDGVLRFWIAGAPATPLPPHLRDAVEQRAQQGERLVVVGVAGMRSAELAQHNRPRSRANRGGERVVPGEQPSYRGFMCCDQLGGLPAVRTAVRQAGLTRGAA
jgi:predicted acetyltransferase